MNDENHTEKTEALIDKDVLLDSTYPLLKEFRETCPGTYKHGQTVSSMVEGISLDLDLDVNLMKIAALYHDIGKMNNPKFFTENQLGNEDPHKDLDPVMSYQIISRHISDSVYYLVNDANFPRRLIEIVSQHHGNSVIRYFYEKAGSKDKNAFRYKGNKPTCVESAVLMIADSVEATARSYTQKGNFNPIELIDNTTSYLLNDGQLDNVYMRLGDLKKIKEALAKELEGTFQKRVDYGEPKEDPVKIIMNEEDEE